MFVRIKKIKGNEYAYLVNNTWTEKGPRQKTVAYLGRIAKAEKEKIDETSIRVPDNSDEMSYEELAEHMIVENLAAAGFKKQGNKLELGKQGIMYIPSEKEFKKNNRTVCLKLNEGIMCSYTLKKLLEFERTGEDRRDILLFAETIVSSGIKLTKEVFVKLFTKLPKPEMEVQSFEEFEY